jgi:hypothetical protein
MQRYSCPKYKHADWEISFIAQILDSSDATVCEWPHLSHSLPTLIPMLLHGVDDFKF